MACCRPVSPPDALAIQRILGDIIKVRGSVGIYSAILFVWFSTRLFGSLRSVLADVFDIEADRGIVAGKLFDVKVTVLGSVLVVAYMVLSAYLAATTSRGVAVLGGLGLRADVTGQLEYSIGRALAFLFVVLMFFSLYKVLPNRRIRWQTALLASLFTSALFEIARNLFTAYVRSFNPGSIYTGTLTAAVVIVIWIYYAAMLFVLGRRGGAGLRAAPGASPPARGVRVDAVPIAQVFVAGAAVARRLPHGRANAPTLEVTVRKLTAVAALTTLVALGACKKTGEGEYQVQTPEVSTDTTTVRTPTVDVGTDTAKVVVPDVNVTTPAERDSMRRPPPQ